MASESWRGDALNGGTDIIMDGIEHGHLPVHAHDTTHCVILRAAHGYGTASRFDVTLSSDAGTTLP